MPLSAWQLGDILRSLLAQTARTKTLFPSDFKKPARHVTQLWNWSKMTTSPFTNPEGQNHYGLWDAVFRAWIIIKKNHFEFLFAFFATLSITTRSCSAIPLKGSERGKLGKHTEEQISKPQLKNISTRWGVSVEYMGCGQSTRHMKHSSILCIVFAVILFIRIDYWRIRIASKMCQITHDYRQASQCAKGRFIASYFTNDTCNYGSLCRQGNKSAISSPAVSQKPLTKPLSKPELIEKNICRVESSWT